MTSGLRRLDRESQRALERIAGGSSVSAPAASTTLRPGTVLVREWQGVRHHVVSEAGGFRWNGSTYPSLSKVARAITGTAWSGPRFFGVGGSGEKAGRAAP